MRTLSHTSPTVVVGALLIVTSCSNQEFGSVVTVAQTSNSATVSRGQPLAKPIITKQQVEQICRTMTLAKVEALLGSPGQATDDATTPPTEASRSYEWRNSDGSYVWVVFAEGEIVGMGQMGLPGAPDRRDNLATSQINAPGLKDCP